MGTVCNLGALCTVRKMRLIKFSNWKTKRSGLWSVLTGKFESNKKYRFVLKVPYRQMHKLGLLKLILTKCTFAQKLTFEQIFSNFELQCKTRQIFQPPKITFLRSHFVRRPFLTCLKTYSPLGFENLNFAFFSLHYKYLNNPVWLIKFFIPLFAMRS